MSKLVALAFICLLGACESAHPSCGDRSGRMIYTPDPPNGYKPKTSCRVDFFGDADVLMVGTWSCQSDQWIELTWPEGFCPQGGRVKYIGDANFIVANEFNVSPAVRSGAERSLHFSFVGRRIVSVELYG